MEESSRKVVQKETMRGEIRQYIVHQIFRGHYKAGDRIVETQLARQLKVSQAPVREAILELAVSGLLEERPYSGTFVRAFTAEDVEDIYNTRAFIDEYAARRAAERITAEELERLKTLLEEMKTAENSETFVEKDIAFHETVVEAAGSPALKRMWDSLRLGDWTYLSVSATTNSMPKIVRQHEKLYSLLERHEGHGAGAYMFLQVKDFGEEIIQNLQNPYRGADPG